MDFGSKILRREMPGCKYMYGLGSAHNEETNAKETAR